MNDFEIVLDIWKYGDQFDEKLKDEEIIEHEEEYIIEELIDHGLLTSMKNSRFKYSLLFGNNPEIRLFYNLQINHIHYVQFPKIHIPTIYP